MQRRHRGQITTHDSVPLSTTRATAQSTVNHALQDTPIGVVASWRRFFVWRDTKDARVTLAWNRREADEIRTTDVLLIAHCVETVGLSQEFDAE